MTLKYTAAFCIKDILKFKKETSFTTSHPAQNLFADIVIILVSQVSRPAVFRFVVDPRISFQQYIGRSRQ